MSWTTPNPRATGYLVTAATYDNEIINNLLYLHGDAGGTVDLSGGTALYRFAQAAPAAFGSYAVGTNAALTISSGAITAFTRSAHYIGTNDGSTVNTITNSTATSGWTLVFLANRSGSSAVFGSSGNIDTPFTLQNNQNAFLIWVAYSTSWSVIAYSVPPNTLTNAASASIGTVSGTVTPNLAAGDWWTLSGSPAGAGQTMTIAAPLNPPSSSQTARLYLKMKNTSGSQSLALSWNAAYVFTTVTKPTSLALGTSTNVEFMWDPDASNWKAFSSTT